MVFVVIDVGNSRIKVAVYEKDSVIFQQAILSDDFKNKMGVFFESLCLKPQILLSNVGKFSQQLIDWLSEKGNLHQITSDTKMPFVNKYSTPQTLGIDRMVLAAGACLKFPNSNRLVIDAGTCVTYDFINKNDEYLGGAISPGFSLRYKSLNDYTSQLPLLNLSQEHKITGDSTQSSMHSGVVNGLLFEIEQFIKYYEQLCGSLTVILTGGDAIFLAKRLKSSIFVSSNFLLESLFLHHQNCIHD